MSCVAAFTSVEGSDTFTDTQFSTRQHQPPGFSCKQFACVSGIGSETFRGNHQEVSRDILLIWSIYPMENSVKILICLIICIKVLLTHSSNILSIDNRNLWLFCPATINVISVFSPSSWFRGNHPPFLSHSQHDNPRELHFFYWLFTWKPDKYFMIGRWRKTISSIFDKNESSLFAETM